MTTHTVTYIAESMDANYWNIIYSAIGGVFSVLLSLSLFLLRRMFVVHLNGTVNHYSSDRVAGTSATQVLLALRSWERAHGAVALCLKRLVLVLRNWVK